MLRFTRGDGQRTQASSVAAQGYVGLIDLVSAVVCCERRPVFSAVSSGCVYCPVLKGSTQKGCDPCVDHVYIATCVWKSRLSSVFNVNQASAFDGRSVGQRSSQWSNVLSSKERGNLQNAVFQLALASLSCCYHVWKVIIEHILQELTTLAGGCRSSLFVCWCFHVCTPV